MRNQKKLNIPSKHLSLLKVMAVILLVAFLVFLVCLRIGNLDRQTETQNPLTLEEQTQLSEITEYLNSIDEITMTNQKQLSEVSLYSTDVKKSLADFSEILSFLEKNVAAIETNLKKYMEVLNSENTTIHTALASFFNKQQEIKEQIIATNEIITALLSAMKPENETNFSDTFDKLDGLQTSIDDIQKNTKTYYKDLLKIIELFQTENQTEHKELLETLISITDEMNVLINEQLSVMQNHFDTSFKTFQNEISENFTTLNNGLDSRLTQYNNNISERLDQLNTYITNQYNDLSGTINNYDTNQQEYLENMMNTITQKLQTVFQSVSNGKRKLASALLTKGISIQEDATFNETYQGILDIPQQLLIGVEQIPGTISYDYHYHINAVGDTPYTEQITESGGCYTTAVYHIHMGNSSTSGGCYTVANYHTHISSCYSEGNHNGSCPSHTEYHSYDCGTVHDWNGDGHGCDGFTVWDCGGHKYLSCNKPSITGYSLGCGMNTTTIIGYGTSCGLSDGQIIGAHIIYNQSALTMQTATLTGEAHIQEEIENKLIEENITFVPSVSENILLPEEE